MDEPISEDDVIQWRQELRRVIVLCIAPFLPFRDRDILLAGGVIWKSSSNLGDLTKHSLDEDLVTLSLGALGSMQAPKKLFDVCGFDLLPWEISRFLEFQESVPQGFVDPYGAMAKWWDLGHYPPFKKLPGVELCGRRCIAGGGQEPFFTE